jgi:hypothetical protein
MPRPNFWGGFLPHVYRSPWSFVTAEEQTSPMSLPSWQTSCKLTNQGLHACEEPPEQVLRRRHFSRTCMVPAQYTTMVADVDME